MKTNEEFKKIISNNDDEERDIIEQFFLRLDIKYDKLSKSEKPDFEITKDDKLYGFEVTKYYADTTRKGSKSLGFLKEWISFSNELRYNLDKLGVKYKYYYGKIYLRNNIKTFRGFPKDQLMTELLIEIKDIHLNENETRDIEGKDFVSDFLKENIDQIYLENTFNRMARWWLSSLQSGEVNVDFDKLNNIIEEKERKAKKYKNNYTFKYLLIYSAGLGLNDIFIIKDGYNIEAIKRQERNIHYELSKEVDTNIISKKNMKVNKNISYFNKIYVFDHFTEIIYEVYPEIRKLFDNEMETIWVNRRPMMSKVNDIK